MSESTQTSRFLELRALAALEHLRFAPRNRIEGTYSGRHASRQQGGAGEFVDYREYSPGEDLRHLDWPVLARTGKAYVRLMQDETNVVCTLALDTSRSMDFAGYGDEVRGPKYRSPLSKMEYVQFIATALSHIISRGRDQVGVATIADELRDYRAPASNPSHVTALYDTIENQETHASTELAPALRALYQRARRRGVLILLSDFLVEDLEETFAALRLFRHRQSEVIAMHVIHPEEERLPTGNSYRFEGLEGEGTVACTPTEIREAYEKRFSDHSASVRSLALANGCDYSRVSTAIPYFQTVSQFLVQRTG